MLGLPEDVSRYLLQFLGLRSNWRTCKSHEALLIQQESERQSVEAYHLFCWSDLEEIYTWTLFGLRYIVRCQYTDYADYRDWYEDRLNPSGLRIQ